MATVVQNDIVQACRAWLQAAADAVALTDAQVIPADEPGPRPGIPFATVRVLVLDQAVGTDFEHFDDADDPVLHISGGRQDTVSINTYGEGAGAWLQEATLSLRKLAVRTQLETLGFDIEPVGGMNNLSALLDTEMEHRFQRDYLFSYRTHATVEQRVEAVSTEAELSIGDTPVITEDPAA